MKEQYIVIKQGVYIQGVFGTFDTLVGASFFARERAKLESDNYHNFNVHHLKFPVVGDSLDDAWLLDKGIGEVLASFNKEDK